MPHELEVYLAHRVLISGGKSDPDFGEALATLSNAIDEGMLEHAYVLGEALWEDGAFYNPAKAYLFLFIAFCQEAREDPDSVQFKGPIQPQWLAQVIGEFRAQESITHLIRDLDPSTLSKLETRGVEIIHSKLKAER